MSWRVPPLLLEGVVGTGLLLPAPGAGVCPSHKRLALFDGGGAGGEKGMGGGGDWVVSGLAPRASVLGPPPDAVARNTSTLRTGACHGLRGASSPPCSRNPDVDMAPLSVTFGSLLLMGQPTSQLSIRFLSTSRYISPVPHERRGEFREQTGGADEPKHHAEACRICHAAWPAGDALFGGSCKTGRLCHPRTYHADPSRTARARLDGRHA